MAKKTIAKKLPAYKKITDDDLKILYAIKEQMIKDREENISPQQKMLIQVSDFIVDSNKDKLTPSMISKALREIGVSIGTKSIKSFLISRGYEPYKNVKNQAQKEVANETENEVINEAKKEVEKEAENEPKNSDNEVKNIEDKKEVKKDDSVMSENELKRIEKEVERIENDTSLSAAKKHEEVERLKGQKDSALEALKKLQVQIPQIPQGMDRDEYMKNISRTREEAAENRTKKKNF